MFRKFLQQHTLAEYHFSHDFFPTIADRAFWDAFPNEECVSLAEQAIHFSWPVIKATDFMEFKKSGNRTIMQPPHYDRRNHLVLFTLAELKENKGRFLPQIVNGIFAICEESYWGISAHWADDIAKNIPTSAEPYIDLFAAETAEHLTLVAYMLHDPLSQFCPEILDRIEYELETRIKMPYLLHRDYWWMGYAKRVPNNWNPWILSNVLQVFLLTEHNERRLHRFLEKMLTECQHYYDSLPADGGCDEGPGYFDRAGASLFEVLYLLKQATKGQLNLFDDEKLKHIACYLKKVHMVSDLFVNVADAHAVGQSANMLLLYGFARETRQEDLMNFSAAVYQENAHKVNPLVHTHRTIRRMLYYTEFMQEIMQYPTHQPLHGQLEYLPNLQLAVLRQGNLALSVKGGHNDESHNHNDVGSYTLYDGATPVLIDVGIGEYTRFTFSAERFTMIPWTQASYHNIPTVNGIAQIWGKQYHAEAFDVKEDKAAVSFVKAYPASAGLTALTREISLDDKRMVCTDRFTFVDPEKRCVSEVLMCVLPVRIEGNCAIVGEKYRISANEGVISTQFVPFEDQRLESDWKAEGVTKICFQTERAETIQIALEVL